MSPSISTLVIAPVATALISAGAYLLIARLLSRFTRQHFTILDDLPKVGLPRPEGVPKLASRVVICGGSIGGLLAARVCSTHFEEVIIIDPDADTLLERLYDENMLHPSMNPDRPNMKPNTRARVMQYNAFHAAQPIYFMGLQALFPNIEAAIRSFNAPIGAGEYNIHLGGISIPAPTESYPNGVPRTFGMTRAAHETLVRRLVVQQCPNVKFITGTVTGVVRSPSSQSLSGVTYRTPSDSTPTQLEAALAIDCTGATHAGLTWLERAGFLSSLTKEEIVDTYNPHMRYTSSEFHISSEALDKILPAEHDRAQPALIFLAPAPGVETRYLCILRSEGDRITMLTGGSAWPEKADSVGFIRQYTRSLRQKKPVPNWVYDLYDHLEATTSESAFYTDCITSALFDVRYAAHAKHLPTNFIALGDSATRLNPVNGQGMSKALVTSLILDSLLRSPSASTSLPSSLAQQYFTTADTKTHAVWAGNKAADYTLEACELARGETREHGWFMRMWNAQIGRLLLQGDKDVQRRFWQVRHWMAPPTDMFAPSVVGKVLRNVVAAKLTGPPAPTLSAIKANV